MTATALLFRKSPAKISKVFPRFLSDIPTCRREDSYDITIVGGGIVGVATARELSRRYPKFKLLLVEKESKLAQHQTGNNSGVIHAGIYYRPGSTKARFCTEGSRLMYSYLDEHDIPYKKNGKLIVATNALEVKRLQVIHQRAVANGVPDLQLLKGTKAIQQIEPFCNGIQALHSPTTGIVDFAEVTRHFAQDFQNNGGEIRCDFAVKNIQRSNDDEYPVDITSGKAKIHTKYAVTCAGLQSDRLATMTYCPRTPKIIPVRGEYFMLHPRKEHYVKANIYPVPDPNLPFLGVHFTPKMDGTIWVGPNAVIAFKREGYRYSDINIGDMLDYITYPAFWKYLVRNICPGIAEMAKAASKRLYIRQLRRYFPGLTVHDIMFGRAGVRAQALESNGQMVEEFYFDYGPENSAVGSRVLHCRNAPSPGATSSLVIARHMVDKMTTDFKLELAYNRS